MLKPTLLALATIIGATAALPSVASAIDNGPCDHCTMDPIVVKGDRKKTKTTKPATQQIGTGGLQIWLGK
jgi:3-hydroxy-3-methylglutaryl CoA synthase